VSKQKKKKKKEEEASYLWFKHKFESTAKAFYSEFRYRDWRRPYSFCMDPVSPEKLISKEWDNCSWTLHKYCLINMCGYM
jgi:hypothetical protein